jgi:hypothetical protein
VFRFKKKSRRIAFWHEGSNQMLEIGPEWQLEKLALAIGLILYAVYESYGLAKAHLHAGGLESFVGVYPIGVLISIVLATGIAKDAALEALSTEEVRINPESGILNITTELWNFRQTRNLPIAEIRNLQALHSNSLNQRERNFVEFNHGKYVYRFAQGVSNEDRARIVRLLESAGVSKSNTESPSTSCFPSTPPR